MQGMLPYIPVAIRKVIPYLTWDVRTLAITAYPTIAIGRVKSMMTPRSRSRSETKDIITGCWFASMIFKNFSIRKPTCEDCSHCVWNHGPQLHFILVCRKATIINDCRELKRSMLVLYSAFGEGSRRTNNPNEYIPDKSEK